MDTKDLIHNISLLLGAQNIKYINTNSKDMDVTRDCSSVQVVSGGFNIYSIRIIYNYTRTNTRVNLRRKTKLESSYRTLLLPVLLTDKESLIKQIKDLDGPTIHSVEFTTNASISSTYINDLTADGIVQVTILGQTFVINYNEDSELYTFKITPNNINKTKVPSVME